MAYGVFDNPVWNHIDCFQFCVVASVTVHKQTLHLTVNMKSK